MWARCLFLLSVRLMTSHSLCLSLSWLCLDLWHISKELAYQQGLSQVFGSRAASPCCTAFRGSPNGSHATIRVCGKGDEMSSACSPKQTRLLSNLAILQRLKGVWAMWQRHWEAFMLWAKACVCFFGFLLLSGTRLSLHQRLPDHLCLTSYKRDGR